MKTLMLACVMLLCLAAPAAAGWHETVDYNVSFDYAFDTPLASGVQRIRVVVDPAEGTYAADPHYVAYAVYYGATPNDGPTEIVSYLDGVPAEVVVNKTFTQLRLRFAGVEMTLHASPGDEITQTLDWTARGRFVGVDHVAHFIDRDVYRAFEATGTIDGQAFDTREGMRPVGDYLPVMGRFIRRIFVPDPPRLKH